MKVKEFCKQYKMADKVRDGGINFIKQHMTKSYIPYMQKMTRCAMLVDSCWYRMDEETGIKRLAVNTPNLHVMFTMELVAQYTDIEVEYEGTKIVENYDDLRQTGILSRILSLIPQPELKEYEAILDMTKSDIMTNEYQIGAYIKNRIVDISTIVGSLILPALEKAGISKEDIATFLSSQELREYLSSIKSNKE